MANLPNNPFSELRNLEARVDQRLDMLGRAETNLKSLLDSLRHQVAAAFPVVDQLQKLLPQVREQTEKASILPSIGELSAALAVGVDQARSDLEERAAAMRQTLTDDLQAAVRAGQAAVASAEFVRPARADLDALAEAFREEARGTLDSIRESLADQLDLLPTDAKLRVDPIVNGIDAARREAEASVRSAADSAQADMRRRAEQLRQSIDEIGVVLEQRLTQRTAALHQRAEAAMNALRPAMDERLATLLAALESTLQTRERELIARIEAHPQRLDRQLADAEALLMDRLARTERHASDMTAYLEQKLTARTDDLVARLRLKLQQELNQVAAASTPTSDRRAIAPTATPLPTVPSPIFPTAADPIETDAPPTLEASIFVQGNRRSTTNLPNLSPAA